MKNTLQHNKRKNIFWVGKVKVGNSQGGFFVENPLVGFSGEGNLLGGGGGRFSFLVQFYSLLPVTLKITYFFDISQNKLKASPRPISDMLADVLPDKRLTPNVRA